MHTLVFVYGTLKEGFPNFHRNAGQRLPGLYRTVQRWPLYLVGERHSVWLVQQPGQGKHVHGQVFTVDASALQAMDALERTEASDGYRRVPLEVQALDGASTVVQAQAYVKAAHLLHGADLRLGPLAEYGPTHAALYRPRG